MRTGNLWWAAFMLLLAVIFATLFLPAGFEPGYEDVAEKVNVVRRSAAWIFTPLFLVGAIVFLISARGRS